MRIAIGFGVGVDAEAPRQLARTGGSALQRVKVDLGARQRTQAPGQAEGPASLQHIGDDIAQLVDLGFCHAALGDPGRAQANAAGPQR